MDIDDSIPYELEQKLDEIVGLLRENSCQAELRNLHHTLEIVGGVFIGAFLVPLWSLFIFGVPDITSQQIGVYPAVRMADNTLHPLSRTMYKVNPTTQRIIYWMPGPDSMPGRLVDCVVRDKKNWVGYYPFGGVVEMQKGKLVQDSMKQDPNEVYLRRSHWWFQKVNEYVTGK